MWNKAQRGVTLIELIVAIVILGVGLVGILMAFSGAAVRSTDPMVRRQMAAIAEGMMEEIQRMPFAPDGTSPPAGCARSAYGNIMHYNGYNQPICNTAGTLLPGLSPYGIQVAVSQLAANSPLTGVPPAAGYEITVTVLHASGSYVLRGWRTNFGVNQP
ncbi:prepilin-type N-terminal cleavage/methylation domain-containing protein [Massilia sp. erpn]|uniref:type IV pilus modification PilV family protein n=1 Tax=Massilia sp. erpn TaxID=2738142 RepID=UPI00210213D7|nr:prepilin-type N-terminal cleavage/methylation domain-containing protein [Massilia sp. erpn]UTY59873.1 prepilin-type N-terminal cleavage/methylation domain-containing protein [Massilia sp. erpn]